jgi:hypothetical protein
VNWGLAITNGILLGLASGEAEGKKYFHIYLLFLIIYFEWE